MLSFMVLVSFLMRVFVHRAKISLLMMKDLFANEKTRNTLVAVTFLHLAQAGDNSVHISITASDSVVCCGLFSHFKLENR